MESCHDWYSKNSPTDFTTESDEALRYAVALSSAYSAKLEVLTYAKEHDIDLICMGTGGTRFILGVLFGSNTNRVYDKRPVRCWSRVQQRLE